jgi:hypothetical protein
MLGFIGRWAASKGMVSVPNLIGLLNTAAQTAIANSGLAFSSSSTTNTGDSGLANKVASQTPTAGTLANYESSVSFVYYTYVAPPFFPFFPPFFPPYFAPAPFFPPYFAPVTSATISNLSYTATGSTTGTLSWTGTNIDSYMFTGSATNYPSPYNYGTFTATWPGNLVNMVQSQSYTVSISVMPGGASQTITFTHNYAVAPFFPPYFAPAVTPTISNLQVDPTNTGGSITWSSTNQESYCISAPGLSVDGSCGANATSRFASGGSAGTQYTVTVTVYSGNLYTGTTASAAVTFTTTGGVVAPFFPPYFAPAPFFPPYFAPAPFFPPYFAPATYCRDEVRSVNYNQCITENATYNVCYSNSNYTGEISATFVSCIGASPFFPPYFAPVAPFFPPYFAPAPFFPPYFAPATPTVVYIEYGECTYDSQCPGGGEQLVYREYSDGSTTYTYDCCLY